MKSFKAYEEPLAFHSEAVSSETPTLQQPIKINLVVNIFNTDQFSPYYILAPAWTIDFHPLAGENNGKARLTYIYCYNSDSTESFYEFWKNMSTAIKSKNKISVSTTMKIQNRGFRSSYIFIYWNEFSATFAYLDRFKEWFSTE